jgi:hydroxymethylpyrimidine pyrophosphatase-like HAD family hydrolase
MRYRSLACDYDGTLASNGAVSASTVAALERLRRTDVSLLLVTGRELDDLGRAFPHLELFSLVVAENGALLFDPDERRVEPLGASPDERLVAELERRGVPFTTGRCIVATKKLYDASVLEAVRDLGLDLRVILNKDDVMVLPSGLDKQSGLLRALERLDLLAGECVGVGDAENDLVFLQACGYAVAVENALPAVQRAADWVTPSPRGAGVEELVQCFLSGDMPASRRR